MTLTLFNIDNQHQINVGVGLIFNITNDFRVNTESTNDEQITTFFYIPGSSH